MKDTVRLGKAYESRRKATRKSGKSVNGGSARVGLGATPAASPALDRAGGKRLFYEFRVELTGIAPPVWRMIQVPHRTALHGLHQVIQVAMGWTNSHLYLFHVGGRRYSEPSPEWDLEVRDSTRARLAEIISGGSLSFLYEYDLGDSWMHEVTLQRTLEVRGEERPRCTGGARACPPEDCGGPPGYSDFLEAISDPDNDDHEEMLDWAGGHFDPEDFDAHGVDLALRRLDDV